MFEELVKETECQLIKNNIKDLRNNIYQEDYQYKINQYCKTYGFSTAQVINQIKENDIVATIFIKSPKKQHLTENLCVQLLKCPLLPQLGKNAIRFDLDTGEIVHNKNNATKSVDFLINNTYITQKYTKNFGGAQDNQYNDVFNYLKAGSKKYKVGAILDGQYWNKKILELKEYFPQDIHIYCMDDIIVRGETFD